MLDLYAISMLVFLAVLALFFYVDRRNVERQSILLLRKTTKGKKFLTSLGRRFSGFWWVYGMAAVMVGFYLSGFITYWLFEMTITNLTTEAAPGIAFVLPSPTTDIVAAPGFIGVPFWYWIITIFLLIIVHEGSHGLMAAREKVRIKSLGWGLLIAIPLAFVEPDEKQLRKEGPMKQLRVFAAGSFGNFVLALMASYLLVFSITTFFTPSGVNYQGYMQGFPAEQVNLTGTITGINNYTIETVGDLSAVLDEVGLGGRVTITTMDSGDERSFSIVTKEDPETGKGFIGIMGVSQNFVLNEGVAYPELVYFFTGSSPDFAGLLFFMFLINLGVGLFNLLPLGPLDGGRMWRIVLDRFVPKHSQIIMRGLTWMLLMILILNFTAALF